MISDTPVRVWAAVPDPLVGRTAEPLVTGGKRVAQRKD
jgi:hypothetical protein